VLACLDSSVETVAVDRPGWDRASAATGIAGNAAAAISELDRREIGRALVVGHSFGGAVAAWLAAFHPERVSGLVLAAPAANVASLTWTDELLAAPVVGSLLSATMLAGAAGVLRSARGRRLASGRARLDEGYLRGLSRLLARPAAWRSFIVEQRALVSELPELERSLGAIRARTVVVEGVGDRIVPVAAARALARQIDDASLMLLPRAGHLLPHQHAPQLAKVIEGLVEAG
jgi:pimeloyl-ACP methyl ester carboxylesterase